MKSYSRTNSEEQNPMGLPEVQCIVGLQGGSSPSRAQKGPKEQDPMGPPEILHYGPSRRVLAFWGPEEKDPMGLPTLAVS